jgi:hypothetical protein
MTGVDNGTGERLDSWKVIAAYLGRDVGTVRRWERTRGLPVHRVPGGKGSSVFAYTSEIDAWLHTAPQETPAELPAPAVGSPEPDAEPPARRVPTRWRWVVASAAIAALLLLGWRMQRPSASVGDMRVEIAPEGVTARTITGETLWHHRFDAEARHFLSEVSERVRLIGGDEPTVYAATSNRIRRADDTVESGELTALTLRGRPRWTFTFNDTLTIGGKPFGAPWAITAFAVDDARGDRRIAVAAHHWVWGPSMIAVLDDAGRRLGTFANHGWIEQLQWAGPDRLAAGGFSQSKNGGLVALIDVSKLDGQSPEPDAGDQCQSCGKNLPLRVAVMPRTEINLATHSRFNRAILERIGDRLVARTVEVPAAGQGAADAIYEFTPGLDLVTASFSQRYWEVHDQLFAEQKLDHDRAACPDKDGPRQIHTWSAAAGWQMVATR